MKALVRKQFMIAVVALVTLQLACNMGAQMTQAPATPPAPILPTVGNENTPTSIPTEAAQAAPTATKSERGTPDEAKAILQLAVEHYKSVGRDQAFADFNGRVTPFYDRDLYIVCLGPDHIETVNGGFPQGVGTTADILNDVNGNPLGKTIWETASETAINSVDYHWTNPVSGQTEPKTLFFIKVGTNDVCGVGAYNPK